MYDEKDFDRQPPFKPTDVEIEVKIKLKCRVSTTDPERMFIRWEEDTYDRFQTEVRMLLIQKLETELPIEIERFTTSNTYVALPTGAAFGDK
jgi:hypothetical protein